jgi:hypothetical protein
MMVKEAIAVNGGTAELNMKQSIYRSRMNKNDASS